MISLFSAREDNSMKSFVIGLLLEFLVILVSIITRNEKIFTYGTQIIGFGSIGIGIILSGLMSGNIYRRTAVENKNERFKRLNRASIFIMLGTPSIITLIIYYYYFSNK